MYVYSLMLQRAGGIVCATYGNFVGGKTHEIVVARGKNLDLLRPDDSVLTRAQPFPQGSPRDIGKSGCRRIVPGQFLAVDPKGRAVMVSACEKQKLVYVLNRDATARLTISSPLEAHKSNTVTYSVVGVDCGFDNPIFASIELDYSESDLDPTGQAAADAQKHLTFYELDLGLNHVSRKWSEPVDNGANLLVTVPGGGDGPSGDLVCAENFVIYKNQGHPDVRAVIPRRADLPAERGVLVVSAATHRQKSMFFFLLQTQYGDIFKVTLEHEGDRVIELKIKYFDTIPVTTSLSVLKTGFLVAASEFGNHALYQFQAIGEAEDIEASSATLMETEEGFQPVFFQPHGLKNLGSSFNTLDFMTRLLGEVSDSGFLDTTPSLSVSLLGDDSLMQVHPNGIRHIREDGRINE
ncbi:hypothetical protein ZIOFF_027747 [Zingiber officinale]|uniref:Cleavage/polyadenylation specificity factor A subunit N-terminal domain-containing protein n=1 Tax=Zingiber officinale TaxID=94328 RepID=A0A8J5LDE6_ZINOF|nr:hypothetical protein ZIOFF_027747 [Zingiber officinale]